MIELVGRCLPSFSRFYLGEEGQASLNLKRLGIAKLKNRIFHLPLLSPFTIFG